MDKMYRIFLIFLFLWTSLGAQSVIKYSYNFDGCSLSESAQLLPPITPLGNPRCACAMDGDGYYFDGKDDGLALPIEFSSLFSSDFTFDFYFKPDFTSGEMRIFSQIPNCGVLDSLISVVYNGNREEIVFEIGSNVLNFKTTKKFVSENQCWHRFTLVRFGIEYISYLDNELIDRYVAREQIDLSKVNPIVFGLNGCSTIDIMSFKGWIDQLSITTRAMSALEIERNFAYPDRIIQPDTTIFSGDTIALNLGVTCSSVLKWEPFQNLNSDDQLTVLAFPTESTTYTINVTHQDCVSTDSIRVYVAQPEDLNCEKLLLPNAFTPNNDGLNDFYNISNIFLVEELKVLEIYDRWGAKIWETQSLEEGWDGSFGGNPVQPGMYICRVVYVCKGQENTMYKSFSVLR